MGQVRYKHPYFAFSRRFRRKIALSVRDNEGNQAFEKNRLGGKTILILCAPS